jgi:hypothetical protein
MLPSPANQLKGVPLMNKSIRLFCCLFLASLFFCPSAFATTLTFQCDQGIEIKGGRFFDTDSLTLSETTTYNVTETGATVTVELGDPEEAPGYNFAFLQVQVQLPWTHQVWNYQKGQYETIHYNGSISNQAACNANIMPVDGEIIIRVYGPNRGWLTTGCSVQKGAIVPTQADEKCHFDCESWNAASQSCVGAAMNGCK